MGKTSTLLTHRASIKCFGVTPTELGTTKFIRLIINAFGILGMRTV